MSTNTTTVDRDIVTESVRRALDEDIGTGDVTADLLAPDFRANATVIAREAAVICGRPWFDEVFRQLDPDIAVRWDADEGSNVAADTVICSLSGNARALLSGERTALNFLQTLSGTATIAQSYARAVTGTHCRVLDTRKTVPGLRYEQKYAAATGGMTNHRRGLYDAILIKENHIAAAGGVDAAVRAAKNTHPAFPVEVEVENMDELRAALTARADTVLLDNFANNALKKAVELNDREFAGTAKLEASGNITLENVAAVAGTGVDFISVGAVTKNVRAVDLSMKIDVSK